MIIYWGAHRNTVQSAMGVMVKPSIGFFFSQTTASVGGLFDVILGSVSVPQPTVNASVPQPTVSVSVPQPTLSTITVKNDIA